MVTFRQYLEEKAKHYSPTHYSPSAGGDIVSSPGVNDKETDFLDEHWKPVVAKHDDQMVGSLLKALTDYLEDRPLPVQQAQLDRFFEPLRDMDRVDPLWTDSNTNEYRARTLVDVGALSSLMYIMRCFGHPIRRVNDCTAPSGDLRSPVDFALSLYNNQNKKILVQTAAPAVLQAAVKKMQTGSFHLPLQSQRLPEEEVIVKLCLNMAAHKIHWAALTSHDTWVFLRLHPDLDGKPPEPYVSFSTAEKQRDNTRPFRALFAMMLATAFDLSVESHTDNKVTPPDKEEKEHKFPDGLREDKSESSHEGMQAIESPGLVLSWSEKVVQKKKPKKFPFQEIGSTALRTSLGAGTIRIALQNTLGKGLTGVVYGAKLIGDESSSKSYAIKCVVMGAYEEKKGFLRHLRNEFNIYCKIEEAKQNGEIPDDVAPGCYGLYESDSMLALFMDCEGESLTDEDWRNLTAPEKIKIFEAVAALHKIGIGHYDLEARNIVRCGPCAFKIIDFAFAATHQCTGIIQVPWYAGSGHERCSELAYLRDQFGIRGSLSSGLFVQEHSN